MYSIRASFSLRGREEIIADENDFLLKMDSPLTDRSDSNGHTHPPNNTNLKLSPNAFLDRGTVASLLLGNQSPTSAGVSSSVDEMKS